MRSLLCLVVAIGAVACVGAPPVPCSTCGNKCVDLQTDSKNCGTCGKICEGGTTCSAGACVPTCNNTQKVCGTSCVDIQNDPNNCGDCAHRCDPGNLCVTGICQGTCSAGYATCLTDAGTPYCADLGQDSRNCGACGHGCGTAEACVMSQCSTQCGMGRSLCTPMGGGPLCADLNTDPSNCGACNQPCTAGLACNGGHCDVTCNAPLVTCTADAGTAAHSCADTSNDPLNCGACGAACPPSQLCFNGACVGALASSCEQLHDIMPSRGDGEAVLYLNGKSFLPFRAACADMDGGATMVVVSGQKLFYPDGGVISDGGFIVFATDSGVVQPGTVYGPKTYIKLPAQGPGVNDSEYNNSGFGGYPARMINSFSFVRFDPIGSAVETNDWRFATTSGIAGNYPNATFEYGTAAACNGVAAQNLGSANINLFGTPFSMDPNNKWNYGPTAPPQIGSGTIAPSLKTASVVGGGSCSEFNLDANPLGARRLRLNVRGQGCADFLNLNPAATNGVYSLVDGSGPNATLPPLVYCDMSGGGWTLVLKIDGTNANSRFFFSDPLWTNEATYNDGAPDLSKAEAKYQSFMATPFSQVKIVTDNGTQRSQTFGIAGAPSMLQAVLGPYQPFTSGPIGQAGWTTLMTGSAQALQPNCSQEGLNAYVPGHCETRLGILGNNELDCATPDSYAGIGGELTPPGNCATPGFRGYSAGAYSANPCGGGNANSGIFAYVYVR
jgi:hypothetical protein